MSPITDFAAESGKGVSGKLDHQRIVAGKRAFLSDLGVKGIDTFDSEANRMTEEGNSVLFAAIDDRAIGLIAITDPIKASTESALTRLRDMNIRVIMLTGDNRRTAEAIGQRLGISEIEADVEPKDKHDHINRLRSEGRTVAMAGDGINDAPALAAAHVGIARGTGTDVAMESAGITLVKGDPNGIVRAVKLSRAMMRNIRQNLLFAFIYNVIGVPVAAGLLYPTFGILLNPMIAGAAMSFSSVSVIVNALRLRRLTLS